MQTTMQVQGRPALQQHHHKVRTQCRPWHFTTQPCSPSQAAAKSSQRTSRSISVPLWLARATKEDEQPTATSASERQPDAAPPATASTSTLTSSQDEEGRNGTPGGIKRKKRQAESTDAVSSFLTRRFGLAGGLAWLGFLAVGTLGEQVKTRMEVYNEEKNAKDVTDAPEVVLPSGVSYRDLRVGGGSAPQKGYLVVVDYVGKANGQVFEDTKARGKPLVFVYKGRPFQAGLCAGVEEAIANMKAGGHRIIKVPPSMGFGEAGNGALIPGNAELEYDLELLRVSIPPS